MSTRLYKYILERNDGDETSLQVRVWAGTPWVIDVYVGDMIDGARISDREHAIMEWCNDRFGREAYPFGETPRAGRWKRGGATVLGWSWFGFSTEEDMRLFETEWPTPSDGVYPDGPTPAAAAKDIDQ